MNTEIDMGKVNDWLETVRNTFINASELAGKVAGMQAQVNEMSQSLEGLRTLNRTLDENLSWSRSERDRLEADNLAKQHQIDTQANNLGVIMKSEDHYRSLADERASIIATLKSDNDTIAFRNLELEEENAKLKAVVDGINALLVPKALVPMSQGTTTEPVKTVEPFVHPVTGVVQGRDPETKQFVPIKDEEKPSEDAWWDHENKRTTGGF